MEEFYRLYARLIPTDSITEVRVREAKDFSESELLAVINSGRSEADEVESGATSSESDEVH